MWRIELLTSDDMNGVDFTARHNPSIRNRENIRRVTEEITDDYETSTGLCRN